MASVFSDFRRTLSAIAIMSKLTCHYPLNTCTFLSSGSAIAKRKHRFFEPEKHYYLVECLYSNSISNILRITLFMIASKY